MGNFLTKTKQHIRTVVQICFTALTNGYIKGFFKAGIFTGNTKSICVPGLNCYSCPAALGSCPIGSLQATLNNKNYKFAFYISGFLLIFGALIGRIVCGWLCPFGLVQDLIFKIPFFKKIKKFKFEKYLKIIKYVILIFFVILLPLFVVDITGQGKPWFCEYICPSGTLFAGIPLVLLNEGLRSAIGWLYYYKVTILIILLLFSLMIYRPFCRFLCPLGVIYGLFNKISLLRYDIDESKCNRCGICIKSCDLNINVLKNPNSIECIRCAKCINSCPHEAINIKRFLDKNTKKKNNI